MLARVKNFNLFLKNVCACAALRKAVSKRYYAERNISKMAATPGVSYSGIGFSRRRALYAVSRFEEHFACSQRNH